MNITNKKIWFSFFFIFFFSFSIFAQQNHFIYIQNDTKQPFYVKLNKKILSSSAIGYIIIPKLQEGNHTLYVGFPKKEWPEQVLNVTIQKKDLGFLLKNFDEKGWTLVNMQNFQVINSELEANKSVKVQKEVENKPLPDKRPEEVSNTIKSTEPQTAKNNQAIPLKTQPEKKPETKTVADHKPTLANEINDEPNHKKPSSNTVVKRLFYNKDETGIGAVYVDIYADRQDTIRIYIPISEKPLVSETKIVPPPVIKQETEKAPIEKESKEIASNEKQKTPDSKPQIKTDPVITPPVTPLAAKENSGVQNKRITCQNPATEEAYKKLRKKMASAENDNEMLYRAYSTFQKICFTTEQIRTLSFLFLNDDGKYKFFDTAYPFVLDEENYAKLGSLLSDDYYVKRFNAMLKN